MAKREVWDLRKIVGLRETKGLRVWLIVATFLSIAANFVAVLGCMSPATLPLYLYRVNRPQLASAVSNIAHQNITELNSPELPDYWYWGMSGVCAVHESGSETHCWRSFPPIMSLDELIEFSLESHSKSETDKNSTLAVLSSWKEASSNSGDRLQGTRPQFIAMSKASAALAILSLIVGIALLSVSIASMSKRWEAKPALWVLYLISIVDGLIFLGSGILSIFAMNNGISSIILNSGLRSQDISSFSGPGMYTLFGGSLMKFAAVGLFLTCLFMVVMFVGACVLACCLSCCEGDRRKHKEEDIYTEDYGQNFR